jgi:PAS domain S-box-containing protein
MNPQDEQNQAGYAESSASLRQRAEFLAESIDEQALAALSPAEIRAIFHELHVHQIELEMQNEDLRRAQEALDLSRTRYFELYDLAPVGYITLSERGLIVEANLRAATMLGTPRSALVKQPLSRFILPEDQAAYYHYRQRIGQAPTPHTCELRLAHMGTDDAALWVRIETTAQEPGDDAPLYRVILSDINQFKRAEAERERLLRKVQDHAQQIAGIMNAMPDGVLLLDQHGHVLVANATGEQELALLAGATVGQQLTHLGELPVADLVTSPGQDGIWHEFQADQRTLEAIACPLPALLADDLTPVTHWTLVIHDATPTRNLHKQIDRQQRLAAVGQLAAGIAHDFNNILAVIALQVPMLARSPGLSERDRQRLNTIQEQVAFAARLIQQILDFSRRAVLERHPLDLLPFLKDQVNLLARTLPDTIQVSLDYEPGEFRVLADPTRMQQIIMNLAVNARDAMPKGGYLRLGLTYHAAPPRSGLADGPWARLTVADSGSGLSDKAKAHLFEPFFTTKSPGQGSGLGLAQVHGIVKQHGGEIEAKSEIDQGTTFTIYLPAVIDEQDAHPFPVVPAQDRDGGQTILLVEDNAVLLGALSEIVEILGYRAITAPNGTAALALLETHASQIDLVLSDLTMPVMSGDELLLTMRARGLTMPMVILSGYPLTGELEGLAHQGLAGWLLKPVEFEELSHLLAHALA